LLVAGIAKVRLGLREWRTFPLTVTLGVERQHFPRRIMFPSALRRGSGNQGVSVMRMTLAVMTAIAVTCAIAACGGSNSGASSGARSGSSSSSNDQIRQTLARLQDYSRSGDAASICSQLFTPRLALSVAQASKTHGCVKEIRNHTFNQGAVVRVTGVNVLDTQNATAHATVQRGIQDLFLMYRFNGQWRIRGIQAVK
jgi:hypothetical protein